MAELIHDLNHTFRLSFILLNANYFKNIEMITRKEEGLYANAQLI